jgi:DNA-directed RNA polymerase III subunit RPC1
MNKILGEIREKAGNVLMKTLPKRNTPRIMATCGSKGSNLNLCQMISCVGPQVVNGARIPDGFGDRTLPHFQRHSKAPDAKGFVGNAFYDGLTAIEFFFHTISGREGLIDTAVKTANSGYMHRRLMKSMEDLVIKYDGTVRASGDEIIQFRYGDDGLDPMSMDDDKLPVSLGRLYTQVR